MDLPTGDAVLTAANVIPEPLPHVLVTTRKQLHGWWPGKRECTAERMLINPYIGCSHGCWFCYALSYRGRFARFRRESIITVCQDFDQVVAKQLDAVDFACCGYLSPVTDPFQPLNQRYRLSERIVRVFVDRNIPIEFITKGEVSNEAIELIKDQEHSFGQVSILTVDEELRAKLAPGGASTGVLLDNLERLARAGKHAVCRIDPLFPGLTDDERDLEQLVTAAANAGARHVVASYVDIRPSLSRQFWANLSQISEKAAALARPLLTDRIGPEWHVNQGYRTAKFTFIRDLCQRHGLTFALCMEYRPPAEPGGSPVGMNREFATSANCEGIDIPVYRRSGHLFEPAPCQNRGACLTCTEATCGIHDLAMGIPGSRKGWRLADYLRWTRQTLVDLS